MPGATVQLKGTGTQVIADQDGNFNLQTSANSGVLVISFVGYETKEFAFSNAGPFIIVLIREELQTDDIVVLGYGTSRKNDVTGAVSSISPKHFQQGLVTTTVATHHG